VHNLKCGSVLELHFSHKTKGVLPMHKPTDPKRFQMKAQADPKRTMCQKGEPVVRQKSDKPLQPMSLASPRTTRGHVGQRHQLKLQPRQSKESKLAELQHEREFRRYADAAEANLLEIKRLEALLRRTER
jgi:hypothetical protein